MKLYKSYGVIAHEKNPFYSETPASDIYDVIEVNLPDGWSETKNGMGQTLITSPGGIVYIANDIVRNWDESPALVWWEQSSGTRHEILKVIGEQK